LQAVRLKSVEGDAPIPMALLAGARLLSNFPVLLRGCPGDALLSTRKLKARSPSDPHHPLGTALRQAHISGEDTASDVVCSRGRKRWVALPGRRACFCCQTLTPKSQSIRICHKTIKVTFRLLSAFCSTSRTRSVEVRQVHRTRTRHSERKSKSKGHCGSYRASRTTHELR
jgi:hypothetical protein